ncbi:MAG: hypothetical protein KJ579_01725 [Verrucomicrobia bacterium]|nr:hypothetical protein [Verrucomicrobiota bacterium]
MSLARAVPAMLAATWLAAATSAQGHGLTTAPAAGGMGVVAAYDDGSPVPYADARLFAPGQDGKPVLTGTTDRNGCFMFRPDTAGVWRISIDDGMGHAVSADVVSGGAFSAAAVSSRMPKTQGVLIGLAVIFSVFGWGAYLRLRAVRR